MRLTTDSPKNNVEMALNLFFVKDKEVWVRGYGKDGADISLFDLSRDLTRWNCPYVDLDISDDSFSMMMAEWLWEDVESFEHVLALLYQAAWVCAELRERLKAYEDIAELCGGFDRLRELAEADKDGRVIILPCKVGDKLYRVFAGEIFEHRVGSMKYFAIQGKLDIETYPFLPSVESGIGKTIFLTREEAEKALREMEGKP